MRGTCGGVLLGATRNGATTMGFHWEFVLPLAIIALLFFGPKRLPEVGSSIGKTIREFQKSMREVSEPHEEPTPSVAPPAQQPQVSAPAAATEAPQDQGHAGSVGYAGEPRHARAPPECGTL